MPEVACAFHPDRLTSVSCSNCGRPICPSDMIPAPVGYQCPVCTGRAREGSFGAASYRTRSAVSQKADRVPLVRMMRGAGITQMLIALNVAIFVAMLLTGNPQSGRVLLRFGAMPSPLPRDQWWRLFTAMFVHVGLFSLAFSHSPSLSAGASGAVFGILGAWIAFFVRHRHVSGARGQLQSLFFLVGINLFIGVSSGGHIDNFAHLGGLVGGFTVATALEQSVRLRGGARALVAVGGYAAVMVAGIWLISTSGKFGGL